jgi:hypothetical protein
MESVEATDMKRVQDILPKKADVAPRVRGDALGVAADWRSLEALAGATRKRFEEDGSDEAKERYLAVIEAVLPVVGVDDAQDSRKRHHELVVRVAPGSLAGAASMHIPRRPA